MIPSYANRTNAPLELKRISWGPFDFDGLELDGELYFYAPSLARILGYSDAPDMLRGTPDDEVKKINVLISSGDSSGSHKRGSLANFLSEPGFYRLLYRTRSEHAKPYIQWISDGMPPVFSVDLSSYSELQRDWLAESPTYLAVLPFALAGYSPAEIAPKIKDYEITSGQVYARITKLKALGFLPANRRAHLG